MTYKELLEWLQSLPSETLNQDATVFLFETDEYIPVESLGITFVDNGVLDKGHAIISILF